MADSQIDYAVVLDDLKAKRAKLDAAIAGIEAMLGLQSAAPAGAAPSVSSATDLGPGAFLGMKIVEAAAKLLAARRQALKTEEIVAELRRGGMAFSGDTPINTVGSVLNRDFKQGGEIVSVARGTWGLAEWHPRLRRKRQQNGSESLSELVDAAVDDVVEDLKPSEEASSNAP